MTAPSFAERSRLLRLLILAALVLAGVVRMRYAAVHMDLARDMFIAWRGLHGDGLPWNGPVLAGTIHLGPAWYWLLTLLLLAGRSWLGALLLLGLLASLQYPLAYLAGKELHSRRAGLLWAGGLLIPNWSSFEWLLPLHYLLSGTCVLAFVLCAARFRRAPRRRYLAGMALAFVLALHAHPANAGLAWVALALAIAALHARRCGWGDLALAAALGLLPLLPYFAWDAAHGFADLRAGAHYLGSGEHTGHLSSALPLLGATAIGGTQYWFAVMLHWPPLRAGIVTALVIAMGVVAMVGLLRARAAPARGAPGLLLGAALAVLLTLALLRDMTPYYMTTPLRTLLVGIAALGWAGLGEGVAARLVRTGVAAVALASFVLAATGAAQLQKRGDWPFNFFPLFNVTAAEQGTTPLLLLPAYGVAASGEFLCAMSAPSAHGVLAQYLLHGYAIDMRLQCGRTGVQLGGTEPDRTHWLGLSRAMWHTLGRPPERWLASIGVVRAQPVAGTAIAPAALPVYPAYLPAFTAPAERAVRFRLGAQRHVAVSNIAFGFAPDPEVAVVIAGQPVAPAAVDAVARVYACNGCSEDSEVEVRVRSVDVGDVDIVTF